MLSSDKNIETIEQLVELLKHYLGLQSEYVRLDVADRVVRLLTAIFMLALLVALLGVMLIYLSFAAAFALAPVVGMAAAFALVAVVYLVVLLLFIIFRHQWIEKPLVKIMANILLRK